MKPTRMFLQLLAWALVLVVQPVSGADAGKTVGGQAKGDALPATNAPVRPYRLYAVLDPDREKMVAFAMKVPSDWRAQQSFHRVWDGAIGQPQVFVTLQSPELRSQIVYFPTTQYLFSEGPMTDGLRAQKRSLGLPVVSNPNELAPMAPVEFLRSVFLPRLAANGVVLKDLGNEQTAPKVSKPYGATEARGSIDGTLSGGIRARVEVRINHSSRQLGSDLWHSWSALASVSQTGDDLESVHVHTRIAQDSVVMNPAWVKLEQEAQAQGSAANREASRQLHEATMANIQANTAAMTRSHHQRMDAIRAFGEANTARFNERMTQGERDQRIRVDTIRGETRYSDPATGDRVKVTDGFNHVYRSRQNPELFLGSEAPIDPGALDWQQLRKVQLEDY